MGLGGLIEEEDRINICQGCSIICFLYEGGLKTRRAFGFGSRPGAVRLSMRQRQHSKKLVPADWPIGVFPSQPVSSAVVRKSCCGGSPTMAPKSLIICAWSAKPQA